MGDLRTLCGARRLRALAATRGTSRHQLDQGGEMSGDTVAADGRVPSPARYFEHADEHRGPLAEAEPVCLYLETTNRCNLLCATCPRTFEELAPPPDIAG